MTILHRIGARAVIVQDDKVLAIEYYDEHDTKHPYHYNLPGGGVKAGESIYEALERELREEASVEIDIGRMLFVTEYIPARHNSYFGPTPGLTLHFLAHLKEGQEPAMPRNPDPMQIAVRWVPLDYLPCPYIPNGIRELYTQSLPDVFIPKASFTTHTE